MYTALKFNNELTCNRLRFATQSFVLCRIDKLVMHAKKCKNFKDAARFFLVAVLYLSRPWYTQLLRGLFKKKIGP